MRKTENELKDTFSRMVNFFDFEKVREAMREMNWTWTNDTDPPSIDDMKGMCWRLFNASLYNCLFHKARSTSSSGGFQVEISKKGNIALRFLIDDISDSDLADYEEQD